MRLPCPTVLVTSDRKSIMLLMIWSIGALAVAELMPIIGTVRDGLGWIFSRTRPVVCRLIVIATAGCSATSSLRISPRIESNVPRSSERT